ncbi:energy-coupling factor transporter transmembrane component T [Clostridium sp. BJN0001]|uniref:energy-coupling factor transporter transmembrane component T family protein n=1 Tax=Clostridium sp. BJN0001 TaxID=2930219 RepID=UPI001FD32B6A|nr:energy-coupling factor transporter transmembrane component T [Clostridium sp. BJN0001]
MKNEFTQAERNNSFFSRLDVRTKLVILCSLSVIGMLLDRWQVLFILFVSIWILIIISRISYAKIKSLILLNFISIWGIIWLQAIFYEAYPRHALFYIIAPKLISENAPLIGGLYEGVAIYYEGFVYGMIQSLRLVIPMTFGLLIFWTEDPVRILIGLNKLKLPYTISFMVMTCIRFIPITFSEAKVTFNSQKLRKYKPLTLKGVIFLYGIYDAVVHILVPLFANCIRKSENMAKSADSRAFRAYDKRTEIRKLEFTFWDKAILALVIIFMIIIIICKILLYFSNKNIYYTHLLLPMYWFTRKYL